MLRIQTPYSADAFDSFLDTFPRVRATYPDLTYKLRNGFSMGDYPPLQKTVIWPNARSAAEHQGFLDEYFAEEVEAGRLSGPFTQTELEGIFGGPFQCSPLTVDVQPQPEGAPDKLRLCINLSKGDPLHPSTNDHVDSSLFPTRFTSMSEVAEIVSRRLSVSSPLAHFLLPPFFFSYPSWGSQFLAGSLPICV